MNKVHTSVLKKLAVITSGIGFLLSAPLAFAQGVSISPPSQGYKDIGNFLSNGLQLIFIISVIVVLIMVSWGALEWVLSGGNKEKVEAAQKRITHAFIGFVVLAVAFALTQLAANFLGFKSITDFPIPSPAAP